MIFFADFKPISLCNPIYKLISKIIAIRIKPVLSKALSLEEFGFLHDRQILDAIGITQKVVHSIKQKEIEGSAIEDGSEKDFYKVDWDFLRLILIQIGMLLLVVKWIMAYVTFAQFVVLVNGAPYPFFKSGRGMTRLSTLSFAFSPYH